MLKRAEYKFDMAPWARSVTKILAFAEDRGARIIGVTSGQAGAGVSLLSRELAIAYARYGINSVLVDASRLDMAKFSHFEGENAPFDLVASAHKIEAGVSMIDLADHASHLPARASEVQQLFEAAAGDNAVVIVDLPPVQDSNQRSSQVFGLVGSACTLVYLVCLSGVTTKAGLSDSVEICRISRVPISGLIINDWKQPEAKFATGW